MPAKRPKLENTRPSRTRRNLKGSHELKVSSEITLKELKLMVSVSFYFNFPTNKYPETLIERGIWVKKRVKIKENRSFNLFRSENLEKFHDNRFFPLASGQLNKHNLLHFNAFPDRS